MRYRGTLRLIRDFCILLGFQIVVPVAYAGTDLSVFASLRAERVHVRAGPGTQYPISWIYVRRGLPVLITARFEFWRKIRDYDGDVGWIHQSLISNERTGLVIGGIRPLRNAPSEAAPVVLYAEPGVQGHMRKCEKSWCEISISDHTGWMQTSHLWGVENE